jgi:hypothetical protein
MSSIDPFDEAFVDSLRQMTPQVPAAIKSRLLYECGAAAAQSKFRKQQLRNRIQSVAALLIAVGLGAFAGNQFSAPSIPSTVADSSNPHEPVEPVAPQPTFFLAANPSTLTAAMSAKRVYELLDREIELEPTTLEKPSTPATAPFGTLSLPQLLK